ncbi:MAG: uroporphyrinogen decarboxylase family protein [candidate division WOR-3 bacterium]
MPEILTPRERFGLLVIDEVQDRVPVFPLLTSYAAVHSGVPLRSYYTDGETMAKCQLQAREFYQTDFISIFSEVGIIAEGLGSEYFYPEDDLPVLSRPKWLSLDDAVKQLLHSAGNYESVAGRLTVYLDAIHYAYEAIGDRVPILAYIPAPFTTAQQLIDPEEFLLGLIECPDLINLLLTYALNAVLSFSRKVIRQGALPILVDPLASGSVLGPTQYQEFALPFEKAVIDFWHRYDLDVILHICGDTSEIINLMPETGADLISVDKIELEKAVRVAGGRVRIVGNFDTSDLLLGTSNEVAELVQKMLILGKTCPRGYVAATGCEVPLGTPRENVLTFVQTAKRVGIYDFPKGLKTGGYYAHRRD